MLRRRYVDWLLYVALWKEYADEPKTALLFLLASAIMAITFVSISLTVHSLAKD